MSPASAFQWVTTAPNPAAGPGTPFWSGYDCGQRGWRLHAVEAEESETFPEIRNRRSACGLLPAHGWDLDLFIEHRCARCVAKLQLPENDDEMQRRIARESRSS